MVTKEELDKKIKNAKTVNYNINEIFFDESVYSRTAGLDRGAIEDYSRNILSLPPIIINQNCKIVDGAHRFKAFQKKEQDEIPARQIELEDTEIKLANLILDLRSGVRHPEKDIKQICIDRWSPNYEDKKLLWTELGIAESTFYEYTENLQREHKEQVYRSVIDDLLLVPELNIQEISERNSYAERTIRDIKNKLLAIFPDSGKNAKTDENELFYRILAHYHEFIENELYLYNIWNTPKGDNNSHFGHFPMKFAKNLLYYHTEPFDVVYDPFAGSGTLLDACRFMFRKCLASDRKPPGDRKDEILEWDIKDGLPAELPNKTELVFLDPPYWKQAENKYSEDAEDLGNMDLDKFNDTMSSSLKEIVKKKIKKIAIVIQPTQYKNNWTWTDHTIDFHSMISNRYEIEHRYILPYSTQQYLPQMVEKAKENKKCLSSFRDLTVWRIK